MSWLTPDAPIDWNQGFRYMDAGNAQDARDWSNAYNTLLQQYRELEEKYIQARAEADARLEMERNLADKLEFDPEIRTWFNANLKDTYQKKLNIK